MRARFPFASLHAADFEKNFFLKFFLFWLTRPIPAERKRKRKKLREKRKRESQAARVAKLKTPGPAVCCIFAAELQKHVTMNFFQRLFTRKTSADKIADARREYFKCFLGSLKDGVRDECYNVEESMQLADKVVEWLYSPAPRHQSGATDSHRGRH